MPPGKGNKMPIVFSVLTRVLTSQAAMNLIVVLARELAKRTDNKIDDAAVEVIADVIANGVTSKD